MTDIEAGLKAISSVRRADGETAFPEIQAIVEAAQKSSRDRRIAADRERRMADEAAERRRRRDHPEDFIADDEIKAMADRLAAKVGFEEPKEIIIPDPVMYTCPQCSFEHAVPPNLRFWTAEECRRHADVLDELDRIADKNRQGTTL